MTVLRGYHVHQNRTEFHLWWLAVTYEELEQALDEALALVERNTLTMRKHGNERRKHQTLKLASAELLTAIAEVHLFQGRARLAKAMGSVQELLK